MPFNVNNQAIVAFKHLLGKSNTDVAKGVNNEFEGIGLTITGQNVWIELVDPSPTQGVIDGVAVSVSCDTILDATSNGHTLFVLWPAIAPVGTDPKTGLAFAYGTGALLNISPGDRVRSAIPDSFGVGYLAKPFNGGNAIAVGDQRDWIHQYNSGIFFQEDGSNEAWGGSPYGHPDQIDLYVYIGDTVLDISALIAGEDIWDITGAGDIETATNNSPNIPNVLPRWDDLQDLGSSSKRWKDLFLGSNIDFTTDLAFNLNTVNIFTTTSAGIITANGKVIEAANGGGQLDLRAGGDGIACISTDGGAKAQGYAYLTPTFVNFGWGNAYMAAAVNSIQLTTDFNNNVDLSRLTIQDSGMFFQVQDGTGGTLIGEMGIRNNSAGGFVTTDKTNLPGYFSSQDLTVNINVINSVAIGGDNIIMKTNHSAYANQYIFNAGAAFETVLAHITATADRTQTLQDKSGTIALLSDVVGEDTWDVTGGGDLETAANNSPGIPNVLPRFDDLQDLGSTTRRWKDLYLGSVIDFATDLNFDLTGTTSLTIDTAGIRMPNGKLIQAVNGGGQLDLRYFGDNIVALTTDAGNWAEGVVYMDTAEASFGFNYTGSTISNGLVTYTGGVKIQAKDIPVFVSGDVNGIALSSGLWFEDATTERGVIINSRNSTINADVNRSVIIAGTGITAKTPDTAYFNQISLQLASNPFDGLVVPPALSADRTWTMQDASGTVAFLSDITAGAPTKYIESFIPGSVGVANTITHNLATEDLVINLWHNKKKITADTVEIIDPNTIEVTFTGANPAEVSPAFVKITILGL